MPHPPGSTGAPRWPVLWALVAGVLVAHIWLVGGGLPATGFSAAAPLAADRGLAAAPPARASAGTAEPGTTRPPAVTVSRVRWIAPPPPAPPVEAPAAAAPRPKPRPAPRPVASPTEESEAAPPPAPSLEEEVAVTTPSPAEPPAINTPAANAPAETPQATDAPPPSEALVPTTSLPAADTETVTAVATAPDATTALVSEGPAATSPLAPAQVASSIDLYYDLRGQSKGLNYSADAQLQWKNDGQRYRARLDISAFLMGSRTQTSDGSLGPNGLAPERYGDQRRRSERATHFDATSGRIRFSNNAPDAAWAPGAQDRLSMFLQLAALLQAQPKAYPPGSRITLLVAGTGNAELWTFQVGAPETLVLPAGEISAVHLLRPPRHPYDSTVDIWLAPNLQHLPVRIRLTEENGSYADQLLRGLPSESQ